MDRPERIGAKYLLSRCCAHIAVAAIAATPAPRLIMRNSRAEFGHGQHLSYAMCGMQGWRRTMEDAHVCTTRLGDRDGMSLFGVFDGHGGAEVAQFCAKYLARELVNSKHFQGADYDQALKDVFHQMDRMLRDNLYAAEIGMLRAASNGSQSDYNSPSLDNNAIVSQLQEFKRLIIQSQAGKAIALSYDHKPMNISERTRIENAGGTVSNAGGVPRVNGNLNLSRAIGDLKYKANSDLPPEAQIISAHPDVRVFELSAADHFFLLACDGVWDVLSNEEAVQFVASHLTKGCAPSDVVASLADHCISSDPKQSCGVGCDNMTSIVVVLH